MVTYLGDKVEIPVSKSVKKQRNSMKNWDYGYNEDIDTVIISKNGTLGEVFNVMGLNIGLPEMPPKKEILNHGKSEMLQRWSRDFDKMPKELTYDSIDAVTSTFTGKREKKQEQIEKYLESIFTKHKRYIDSQYKKREQGVWIYLKGIPIYLTGTYWYGIQWVREISEAPNLRIIQNDLMIFWEACKADRRCFGMQYVKNRRMGASLMAIFEMLDAATLNEDKLLGMISKKGDDASKIFRRYITAFKRLPSFFRPIWDGTNNPKKKLNLEEATKRKSVGDSIAMGNGLGTMVEWHSTDLNAMDGDAVFRSLVDEAGKFPKETPFSKYWEIVKTAHRTGLTSIKGKAMVVSTVNALKKGGSEYKKVWDQSDCNERDGNGQTKSGLYRVFIPTKYCMEGFFDQYGFSILEDPETPIKTDEGEFKKLGSISSLQNSIIALEKDPEDLNEFMRQNPARIEDAFRDESDECEFNLIHIQEQLDHNKWELNDQWEGEEFIGNDDVERGNFRWENGIKDTTVIWTPNPKGRFFIRKGCHPPKEFRNSYETVRRNGVLAKAPLAGHIGTFGVDPYNRSKNADGRGSKGAIILTTRTHTCDDLPNEAMILEYIARPKKVEYFFEDVIMVSVYFSMPFLSEQSNDRMLAYIKDRGYRHFSMNNPFKKFSKLSPAEIEFGGAPQQDTKIGEAQFYATEAFVQDHVGVARDDSKRLKDEMGDMPFTRTLIQLKDVDTSDRTKYDAYIAKSLSLVANQKHIKKQEEKPTPISNPFSTYDNSGRISAIAY